MYLVRQHFNADIRLYSNHCSLKQFCLQIGLLMFKYSIHSLPSVIEDLFTCNTSVSNDNTRNKSKLRQPRSNCEYMYRNISFTGVYIWNKIQDHINVYSTYSTFKDALKSFLLVHDLNYRIL